MDQVEPNAMGEARNREETQSVHSHVSMIVSSNGGSNNYPYPSLLKDTSFARYHLMATPGSRAETFNGSLRMLGHGTPLWTAIGDLGRPKEHLTSGVCIGDVGFLTREGEFETFFNLFLPPDHPAQANCPDNLIPLDPPSLSELVVDPTHFPPGTVLASNGVQVSTFSSSPLDVKFTMTGREGAMLVLPDGASREDLLSTTRVRDYVHKHALSWYMFAKEALAGVVVHSNATLYVVTGTDKSATWASCVTYSSRRRLQSLWKPSEITYRGARADSPHSWESNEETEAAFTFQRSRKIEHLGKCALFIRGMRVAVNVRDWTEHLHRYNPPDVAPFSLIRTVPIAGLRAKIQNLKECLPGYKQMIPKRRGIGMHVLFHPLDILLRLLLEESPSSTIAYIEDHVWSSVADQSDAHLASIVRLLVQILETYESFIEEDRVTLIPRKIDSQPPSTTPAILMRLPTYIRRQYRAKNQRKELLNRLAKVFPGPKVPDELLEPLVL